MKLNDNEFGIKFTLIHNYSAPYSASRACYDVELPEGMTVDDAMSVVRGQGVKGEDDDDRGWWESYASIKELRVYRHGAWVPEVQLTITHPYLD